MTCRRNIFVWLTFKNVPCNLIGTLILFLVTPRISVREVSQNKVIGHKEQWGEEQLRSLATNEIHTS